MTAIGRLPITALKPDRTHQPWAQPKGLVDPIHDRQERLIQEPIA